LRHYSQSMAGGGPPQSTSGVQGPGLSPADEAMESM
jgi:hypothetical protein